MRLLVQHALVVLEHKCALLREIRLVEHLLVDIESAKTRRAASETPIPAADDIALVTTPPGERPLELNDRTPCYGAAADSGADASRSQRRADRVLRQQVASVDQPLRRGLTSSR